MTPDNSTETTVSRLTVATAIDLLDDLEYEVTRADASGPYLTEIQQTIDQLEQSLEEG